MPSKDPMSVEISEEDFCEIETLATKATNPLIDEKTEALLASLTDQQKALFHQIEDLYSQQTGDLVVATTQFWKQKNPCCYK